MMAETPLSSGAKKANVTAWDFALRGSYSWNSDFDIEGRLIFRNASAEFSGDADRPDPISRATQSSKILQLGVSYYF
jgi:long-subunit fatty acid transport protein